MATKNPWDQRRTRVYEVLRRCREDAGLLQSDVAGRLKEYQSYVSKYENGDRRLDLVEIEQICEAIGISLADFIEKYLDRR